MRRTQTDLLIVSLLAIAAATVAALSGDNTNILRAALGLPFVLFLPGYALSAALLPDGRAGFAERVAFSIGLSITVAAIGGLLLNFLPSGLTARSWRFLLLGVTLTGAGFALWRRGRERVAGPGALVAQISVREAALLSSAALLIGLALGLGAIGVNPVNRDVPADAPFTQFWAVPSQGQQQSVIRIGLRNYEDQNVTYRVTLESGTRLLAEWPQVTLKSGENWQAQAALPSSLTSRDITANAYRQGDSSPYRRVRLAAGSENSP